MVKVVSLLQSRSIRKTIHYQSHSAWLKLKPEINNMLYNKTYQLQIFHIITVNLIELLICQPKTIMPVFLLSLYIIRILEAVKTELSWITIWEQQSKRSSWAKSITKKSFPIWKPKLIYLSLTSHHLLTLNNNKLILRVSVVTLTVA